MAHQQFPTAAPVHKRGLDLFHKWVGSGEESCLQVVKGLFEAVPWVFAKTMQANPHWYTLLKDWPSQEEFFAAVIAVRLLGTADWWPDVITGRPYVALDLAGFHFWTMNDPLGRTWLINRKYLDASKNVVPPE